MWVGIERLLHVIFRGDNLLSANILSVYFTRLYHRSSIVKIYINQVIQPGFFFEHILEHRIYVGD